MSDNAVELFRGSPSDENGVWSRYVLAAVSNGVTVADATQPDLPLIYANPAFERMTGYMSEEVCGRNCRFLQGSDMRQPDLGTLRQALRDGTDVKTVLRNYRKDGTLFWNELYLSPIRNPAGRLTHYVGIQNDVTARVDLEMKLSHMAQHDMLTGLVNRALLMDRLEQMLLRASRTREIFAVLFLDLDNFKHINDMFGHEAGDEVLKVVAHRLREGTRAYDTAARMGGDEFVVVMDKLVDEHEAEAMMHRIAQDLEKPVLVAGQEFRPSASAGLAMFPCDGGTPEELLRAADTAMYVAKHLRKQREQAVSKSSETSPPADKFA
jgi:diguanylate cyclase (GGDEF)-like protein/PAS domain S-box-containing protein